MKLEYNLGDRTHVIDSMCMIFVPMRALGAGTQGRLCRALKVPASPGADKELLRAMPAAASARDLPFMAQTCDLTNANLPAGEVDFEFNVPELDFHECLKYSWCKYESLVADSL